MKLQERLAALVPIHQLDALRKGKCTPNTHLDAKRAAAKGDPGADPDVVGGGCKAVCGPPAAATAVAAATTGALPMLERQER